MRNFTKEEIATYNKVRQRHPELELPEYSHAFDIAQSIDGILTLLLIGFAGKIAPRMGRAVYSVIDRNVLHQKPDEKIGMAVAFNRALHTPIIWDKVLPIGREIL